MEDKASKEFWTNHWKELPIPPEFNTSDKSVSNFPNLEYHNVFLEVFGRDDLATKSIIEIGCANSIFLPYFKKEFGMDISGLDYSKYGCEREEELLLQFKVNGKIILGDLFNPPVELIEKFDYIFSNGVIEHFENTEAAFKALSVFLKKGGIAITAIPNITGLNGQMIKLLNKQLYDIHVPLKAEDLERCAYKVGFKEVKTRYIITPSLYVTLNEIVEKVTFKMAKKILNKIFIVISRLAWWLQMVLGVRFSNNYLSNMIINIASK